MASFLYEVWREDENLNKNRYDVICLNKFFVLALLLRQIREKLVSQFESVPKKKKAVEKISTALRPVLTPLSFKTLRLNFALTWVAKRMRFR